MTTITLTPGYMLRVQFEHTDGEFQIHFDHKDYPQQLIVRETAGLPGSRIGEANAVLYCEDWRDTVASDRDEVPAATTSECVDGDRASVGFFMDSDNKIHCTALVNCYIRTKGTDVVVVTLSKYDDETGEYTFYPTIEALKEVLAENGLPWPRPSI